MKKVIILKKMQVTMKTFSTILQPFQFDWAWSEKKRVVMQARNQEEFLGQESFLGIRVLR